MWWLLLDMQAASSASHGVGQGEHPHRIWDLIYSQSCFLESLEQCTERRVFYRLISGQLRPPTRLAAAQSWLPRHQPSTSSAVLQVLCCSRHLLRSMRKTLPGLCRHARLHQRTHRGRLPSG